MDDTVNNNSSSQNYSHPDDHTIRTTVFKAYRSIMTLTTHDSETNTEESHVTKVKSRLE